MAGGLPDQAVELLEPLAVSGHLTRTCTGLSSFALAATGRRWDAAAAFERLRDGLAESYGVAPEPETTAVYRRLFVGGTPDPGTRPHNLPTLSRTSSSVAIVNWLSWAGCSNGRACSRSPGPGAQARPAWP